MNFIPVMKSSSPVLTANVAAITEIDHRHVGNAEIGPITHKLSDIYDDIILGNNPKYMSWCTPVY